MHIGKGIKFLTIILIVFNSISAWSHDPIFGLGPHVLFKGGVEISPEIHLNKTGDKKESEFGLNLTYGITGDWAAGIEVPYLRKKNNINTTSGSGDTKLFTKYRFWRKDSLGVQQSASVLLKVKLDNADTNSTPSLGSGSTDSILGLTYGYEGRKWYRWASVRHRRNGENSVGLRRGDKILLDLVGGIRVKPTGYTQPDTVWMVELNGEFGSRSELRGASLANTGGDEWFISPGVFWTKRNFAIKAGVQIPIASDLNGIQQKSDYRVKLVFEWHF